MAAKWHELRPYMAEEQQRDASSNLLSDIMDHIPKLLVVIQKDSTSKIRIYVHIDQRYATVLETLEGLETVQGDGPTLGQFARRYKTRRHTALPIADEKTKPASIYAALNARAGHGAALAVALKKTTHSQTVSTYIRDLEQGMPTEGLSRVLAMFFSSSRPKGSKIPETRQQKITKAKSKSSSIRLFLGTILTFANTVGDLRILESVFPSGAFVGDRIDAKKAEKEMLKTPSTPWIHGAANKPVLSDVELLSFLRMPDPTDIKTTNMEAGQRRTYSSGVHLEPDEDSTMLDY